MARAVGAEARDHQAHALLPVGEQLATCGIHERQPDVVARAARDRVEVAEDRVCAAVPREVVPAAPEDERGVGVEALDHSLQRRRHALGGRPARGRLFAAARAGSGARAPSASAAARARSPRAPPARRARRGPARATCTTSRPRRRAAPPPRVAAPRCGGARRPGAPRLRAAGSRGACAGSPRARRAASRRLRRCASRCERVRPESRRASGQVPVARARRDYGGHRGYQDNHLSSTWIKVGKTDPHDCSASDRSAPPRREPAAAERPRDSLLLVVFASRSSWSSSTSRS